MADKEFVGGKMPKKMGLWEYIVTGLKLFVIGIVSGMLWFVVGIITLLFAGIDTFLMSYLLFFLLAIPLNGYIAYKMFKWR